MLLRSATPAIAGREILHNFLDKLLSYTGGHYDIFSLYFAVCRSNDLIAERVRTIPFISHFCASFQSRDLVCVFHEWQKSQVLDMGFDICAQLARAWDTQGIHVSRPSSLQSSLMPLPKCLPCLALDCSVEKIGLRVKFERILQHPTPYQLRRGPFSPQTYLPVLNQEGNLARASEPCRLSLLKAWMISSSNCN